MEAIIVGMSIDVTECKMKYLQSEVDRTGNAVFRDGRKISEE